MGKREEGRGRKGDCGGLGGWEGREGRRLGGGC